MSCSVVSLWLLISYLFLVGNEVGLEENPYALDSKRACGTFCVGFLDNYFGSHRSYEEISEVCPPGALGLNLEQLESSLRQLGYHTRGVKLSENAFRELKWPCIVHEATSESAGHFLVCIRWQEKLQTFHVFDPPRTLTDLTEQQFRSRVGLMALIVSNEPLPPTDQLVPTGNSGQFIAGIACIVIGVGALTAWLVGKTSRWKLRGRTAVVCILSVLASAGCQRVQSDAHDTTQAESNSTSTDMLIDLGDVHQGPEVSATFPVKNNGTTPFRIRTVERSCRCQSVTFDAEKEIKPGEVAEIGVSVNTREVAGRMTQSLTVYTTSTAGTTEPFSLTLKANIVSLLRAIPSNIMFGAVTSSETREFRILTNPPDLADKFLSIDAPDFLQAKLIQRKRGELVYSVTVADDLPNGSFDGRLTARFDIREAPAIQISVVGRRTGLIDIVPARLTANRNVHFHST